MPHSLTKLRMAVLCCSQLGLQDSMELVQSTCDVVAQLYSRLQDESVRCEPVYDAILRIDRTIMVRCAPRQLARFVPQQHSHAPLPCCLRTQQCFVTPVMKDLRHTAVATVEKQVAQCMRMQPSTAKSKSR